jgi:hypothetical protein
VSKKILIIIIAIIVLVAIGTTAFYVLSNRENEEIDINEESTDVPGLETEKKIFITSPKSKSIFKPGDIINVTVQPQGEIILDEIFLGSPGFLLSDNQPPYEFVFELPKDQIGPREISVLGIDSFDNQYFDEITIDVVTSTVLTTMGVRPEEIEHLWVDGSLSLYVWGHFSDGQTMDLTEVPEIFYSSDDNDVVSVDTGGVVTGIGKGSAVISVTYSDQIVTVKINVDSPNDRPTAKVGPDQTVVSGCSLQLDGSESNDPDTDPLTYVWEIVSSPGGSVTALLSPDTMNPTFTPDVVGYYIVKLTVDDGYGGSDSALIQITVEDK